MDYIKFINIMQNKVEENLYPDVTVGIHRTVKNNGKVRIGLMFSSPEGNLSPTIYLEEFYDQYLHGEQIDELAESIREIYEKVKVKKTFPYYNILDYSEIRERIVYKIIRRSTNVELLEDIPHELFLDLAIVYYVLLETTEFGTATLLIRNEHLKGWNISKEEVISAAKKNTPELLPLEVGMLTDYMYILTNSMRNFGAAVMMYDDVLRQIGEMIGENYYVLPSSIHEIIIVPESFGMDRSRLQEMVEEINLTEVEEEEVLSDNVYYYSRKESRLLG